MLKDLVLKNITYRRFYQDVPIEEGELLDIIDLARLSSSAANLQPLRYIISNSQEKNQTIFEEIRWAAYFKDWHGPEEGEKPSAYIVMTVDRSISKNIYWDHGIACQSILLGATEKGYGGCMFGNLNKNRLQEKLNIPDKYEILLVIALGKPKEEVVLVDMPPSGDVKYYRDEKGVHHVPKRSLEDLVLKL